MSTTNPMKPKTLYELAGERQAELQARAETRRRELRTVLKPHLHPSDRPVRAEKVRQSGDEDALGRISEAFFWGLTLGMLHFTLDVLVHHQYRMEVDWLMISRRTATSLPLIWLIVYMLHPKERANTPRVQILFFVMAVCAGCWLVRASNLEGYFAVMQRAPPLGTLWIWSVIELKLWRAVASLAMVVAFLFVGGYSMF